MADKNYKLCPMLFDKKAGELIEGTPSFYDCQKDVCAWWDEKNQCCAVLTIAKSRQEVD